ncbi:uncharacterized protein DUF4349 [Mumia flava]|uniref:Uncharacterized protein DUF4349 n=1 Tax=Mumia flava TaxID=1348852 RepID=A0A2M9BGV7_9ACTN|nr:DUF4349 domain-containing protein [Mumia flava]PJJ57178.1 uncharacterized protein DUF4349 [Mumia flava]
MTTPPTLPELTDVQVDRMYAAIAAEVDRTETRHRRRRTVGLAAAALVAVAGVGSVVVGPILQDQSSGDFSVSSDGDSGAVAERAPTESGGAVSDEAAPGDGSAGADEDGGVAGTADAVTDREIVTTAYATVEVERPREAADDLVAWAEAAGGRLESRSESGSGDAQHATVWLRVPADRATDATDHLDELGTVATLEVTSDDVTAQGRDLDARISALQVSVERLETLMSQASSTDDLLRAERALSQRQAELDSLQAQRRSLTDQVAMSSVQVDLIEPDPQEAPSPTGFLGGLADGWDAMLAVAGTTVAVVGFVLPWAVALAVLVAALLAALRIRRQA